MANPLYDALLAPHVDKKDPFLVAPDGAIVTYEAFLKDVARMAHALVASGVKTGSRVAVQVEKSQAALALYGACLLSGAVFLPLNTAYTAAEVDYFVSDAKPALIVCDPSSVEALTS